MIRLYDISEAERGLLEHFRPFFPASPAPTGRAVRDDFGIDWKIVGDRLPGMGETAQYQDATAVNVDGALAVEP